MWRDWFRHIITKKLKNKYNIMKDQPAKARVGLFFSKIYISLDISVCIGYSKTIKIKQLLNC